MRREMIGRGLIAFVWMFGDIGQVALAWNGGVGDRAGDQPLVAFAVSALAGVVLSAALGIVNVLAGRALADPSRLARLSVGARTLAVILGVRLVATIGVMVATHSAPGVNDSVPQLTFESLVTLAVLDGLVALAIAAWTVTGLRRPVQQSWR